MASFCNALDFFCHDTADLCNGMDGFCNVSADLCNEMDDFCNASESFCNVSDSVCNALNHFCNASDFFRNVSDFFCNAINSAAMSTNSQCILFANVCTVSDCDETALRNPPSQEQDGRSSGLAVRPILSLLVHPVHPVKLSSAVDR